MKGKVILKSKYKTLRSVLLKEFTIKKILKLLLFSIIFKIIITIFIYYSDLLQINFYSLYLSKAVYFVFTIILLYKIINSNSYNRFKLVIAFTIILFF